MPDLFLYVKKGRGADMLRLYAQEGGKVSVALQRATADVFTALPGPNAVSVRMIIPDADCNVPALQIVAVASKTPERASLVDIYLDGWKNAIASAWKTLFDGGTQEFRDAFPPEEVTVWPMMPDARWGRVSDILSALKS